MSLEEEYKALKSKRGRKSAEQKARLEELERLLKGEPVSEETEAPTGTRVMIMNSNAGMPGGSSGGAVKVFRFDVVETTPEHAAALCAAVNAAGEPMARETSDPVTVVIEDGRRVPV